MTMKCILYWHRLIVFRFLLRSQMLSLQTSLPWETWQELRTESKKSSESILAILLETKVGTTHLQHLTKNKMTGARNCSKCDETCVPQEFALCEKWVELYPVSDQLKLKLKTEHLLHLLEKGQNDEAFQVQTRRHKLDSRCLLCFSVQWNSFSAVHPDAGVYKNTNE